MTTVPDQTPVRGGLLPPDPAVDQWAATRLRWVDNLKVLLIAAIIAGHAALSYASVPWWAYADVREVTVSPITEGVLLAVGGPVGLLLVPLLFLVAGLLTPGSVDRRGPGRYARERLVRLGIPFAVFALLLWSLLEYVLFHALGTVPGSYWSYLVDEGSIDAGPLWFVGVLLLFSLAYAGWVGATRERRPAQPTPVTGRHLLGLAAVVAIATFLVRLDVPFDGDSRWIDLDLWRWPGCLGVFLLGVVASRAGWLTVVPDGVRRVSRTATLGAGVAFALFTGWGALLAGFEDEWMGGWHVAALVFGTLESLLTVFGSVWSLAVAQRRLARPVLWAGPAAIRSAYGAFMVQGPVLLGLAVALRPVPVPAELKALALAVGGVGASFWLAWLLIRHVPGVARVL